MNADTAVSALLVLTGAVILALFALGEIPWEVFVFTAGILALGGLAKRSD